MAKNTNTEADENVTFENARIGFLNFEGKETQYNRKGARNFCVFMDEQQAEQLTRLGWNVKRREPREEDGDPEFYLKVNVKYDGGRPPKVTMLSSRGRTMLSDETISMLDWAEIEKVDLIIRPYHYEVRGDTGISAYLKTMFVIIHEDELEAKYADWGSES